MIESIHNTLLVEPRFPKSRKSANHSDFLPIGLLKLARYFSNLGCDIELIRGHGVAKFTPDQILITSLFTYWSKYVKDCVDYYRALYPSAHIVVGGIYATLMPEHCLKFTRCDEVFIGQHDESEKLHPMYELVDVNYQIIHGMRGCKRKCHFCGIWRIENQSFKTADQVKSEISSNKLIFYDNNFLINPNVVEILKMLSEHKHKGRPVFCECQSGFDGRVLAERPELALLLKNARFKNIRLAWDFSIEQYSEVQKWIQILNDVGYASRDIFIFMIYNWSFDFEELESKRRKCYEWNVQIADCRFRPLDSTFDNYNPLKNLQTHDDYYIHSNWSDEQIRSFRRNVRKHNICLRYNIDWDKYDKKLERSKPVLEKLVLI